MKDRFYDAIFQRKSFHLFRGVGEEKLTGEEQKEILRAFSGFEPLYPGIRTAIRFMPAEKILLKRDADLCILLYSEKKDNYLMNAGFLGEQLDLWLTSHGIGSLWLGVGKPDQPVLDGLDFVIMFAVHKVKDPSLFRKNMFKAKRLPLSETWRGEDPGVAEIVRFAPSAVNSQPWLTENADGVLTVRRVKRPGLLRARLYSYFNRIDIGIYLCFLEICLEKKGIRFDRTLFSDDGGGREETKIAEYRLDAVPGADNG